MIAFAAELSKGVGLRSLMTFSVGFGPGVVLAASFISRKASWKLKPSDYACGLLSVLGIILWLIYNEGNIAIVFSVAADLCAAIPTLVKSYYHPETESAAAYSLAVVNAAITLLTIDVWNVANSAFPIYILLVNIVFAALIKYKLGLKLKSRLSPAEK